ncbi:hypothetical protein [Actinomadura atramentaria]|uniref:hypothetical protein n=1 Tax=Actinomadura atramentaria TaxID=1990 RepID=UPI000378F4EA|nr:hypothetical protein [Actinomadura atramentaria]
MGIVHEHFGSFPFDRAPIVLERDEELLLAEPAPGRQQLRDHPMVEAVYFNPEYVEQPLTSPRGVYEGEVLRLEWQTMGNEHRQGFYHRNTDVDEMSFQVYGERTLMTENGSIVHSPGDFSNIPVGVAHDNYGLREDIHILFYVPAGVEELLPPTRTAEYTETPYPGFKPGITNEMVTDELGGRGHDVVMARADERLLLAKAQHSGERIRLVRPADEPGTTWLYRSPNILIGRTYAAADDGRVYLRHRDAHEIQYQISGRRTLVTQRGTLDVEPGDFLCVPRGLAFTSLHGEPSAHIRVVCDRAVPRISDATKTARPSSAAEVAELRAKIGTLR